MPGLFALRLSPEQVLSVSKLQALCTRESALLGRPAKSRSQQETHAGRRVRRGGVATAKPRKESDAVRLRSQKEHSQWQHSTVQIINWRNSSSNSSQAFLSWAAETSAVRLPATRTNSLNRRTLLFHQSERFFVGHHISVVDFLLGEPIVEHGLRHAHEYHMMGL